MTDGSSGAVATSADAAGPSGETTQRRILGLLPGILAALAEGAWVAVLGALVAAIARETGSLLLPEFVLAALVGLVGARRLGDRPDWPVLTVGLTALAGVVGWLSDPAALGAIARFDLDAAIARHPAGWLAAVAFLRGSAHARLTSSEGAMNTLMRIALPGLAIPLLLGNVLEDARRDPFIADARIAVILFLAAATVGLGVARLAALRGRGIDWRGNRAWLALLVLLVAGVSLLALPIASVVGPLVQLLVGLLVVPALALATIVGFRQVSRRAIVIYAFLWVALIVLVTVMSRPPTPEEGEARPGSLAPETTSDSTLVFVVLGAVAVALLVLGVLFLARMWSRDLLARRGDDVPEERWIDVSEPAAPRPRRSARPRGRRPAPTGAVEAYLATLATLAGSEDTRRTPNESPSEHAARLRRSAWSRASTATAAAPGDAGLEPERGAPSPGFTLALLAADYELARFGDVTLSAAENRRAVERWRRIRGRT